MSTNHQTKENVLNQIKEIENDLKISMNTERNLRETRAIAAIKNNPKYDNTTPSVLAQQNAEDWCCARTLGVVWYSCRYR